MTETSDPGERERCGQVFGALEGLPLACDRPVGHTGTHRVGTVQPELTKADPSPPDSEDYEGGGP